jgi:MoaA/NifB/PqqE/SkfB family radical SAM enzyme
MCDIWKANREGNQLTCEELSRHLEPMKRLNVRRVVLSGGEALMHRNLWSLCEVLEDLDVHISLLSSGLLLERYADEVARWCDEVVVSLDGSRELHDRIRNVPRAFDRLADGVSAVKARRSGFRITGRCVLQRLNFRDLPHIVSAAEALGLDQISFLAADVSTKAFNRPDPWPQVKVEEVALGRDEVKELRRTIEALIEHRADVFASGFIAESPQRLRRLPQYYAALLGEGSFPKPVCNAPWVSAVVEADGSVRPCFFHEAYGNVHDAPLDEILNGAAATTFRRELDVRRDATCRKCVCTLDLGVARRA